MTRNVVRVAILVWMVLALRAGVTTWEQHEVPVVVRVPVTAENPSGLLTVPATYQCAAPIGGDAEPVLLTELVDVVGPTEEPCERFVQGRQLLFWVDVVAGILAMALTFAHLPRQWRDRRLNAGIPIPVS